VAYEKWAQTQPIIPERSSQRRPHSKTPAPPKGGNRRKGGHSSNSEPQPPIPPQYRMQEDEPENFLHLAASLKILLGSSIRKDMFERSRTLLEGYLLGFRQVNLYYQWESFLFFYSYMVKMH
jgi:hypothetical protein